MLIKLLNRLTHFLTGWKRNRAMYQILKTHNGVTQSISDWARQSPVSIASFHSWVSDYGFENAMKLSQMDYSQRREWREEKRQKVSAETAFKVEPFDPDLEFKNRLQSWLQSGMSIDEIKVKARML